MTVLVSDSFNRSDNTTTLGNADTGQTWQYRSGSVFGIMGNQAYCASGSNPTVAYIDSGYSDVSINVTAVQSSTSDYYAAIFRYDPTTNTGLNLHTNPIKLQSFSGGTYTNITTTSTYASAGDKFEIDLNGSTINVYRNGTLMFTSNSTINQTKTCHGIGSWRGATSGGDGKWDDFSVSISSSGTTYIGSGTSTGLASLTTSETFIGIYSANGSSQGLSSLSDTSKEVSSASGSIQSSSTLTSQESKSYSANGSTSTTSVVSSVGNVIYVDFGNSNGQSNLTTSEQLVSPTGTTYSESGQPNGLSSVSSNDKVTYESSVSVNGQSTLITTDHEILTAQGTVQGQSSVTSIETFVSHPTTTYNAMGTSDGTSIISSSETKSYAANGVSDGMTNVTSHDNVVYFPTETANGYTTITTSERYVSVFSVIGSIYFNGLKDVDIELNGTKELDINLKGVV